MLVVLLGYICNGVAFAEIYSREIKFALAEGAFISFTSCSVSEMSEIFPPDCVGV